MEALTKEIYQEVFGYLEQQEIYLFTLRNQQGNTVKITNYGGIITSWLAIDKDGHQRDIVLGFDNLESDLEPHPYPCPPVMEMPAKVTPGKRNPNQSSPL